MSTIRTARNDYRSREGPAEVCLAEEWTECLTELAYRHGIHLLVESKSGRIVAHATSTADPPEEFVKAVLKRCAAEVTAALYDRRSRALLPGGPLVSAALRDWAGGVLIAPLTAAGERVGWLWIFTDQVGLSTEAVARAAEEVSHTAPLADGRHATDDPVLLALADQTPVPSWLVVDVAQLWVAGFRDIERRIPADLLRLGLIQVPTFDRLRTRIVNLDDTTYVVVLATVPMQPAQLAEALQYRLRAAQQALDCELVAALSAPSPPDSRLGTARAQADAVLRHRPQPGLCVTLQQSRSDLVVAHFADAATHLPELGRDPVRALLDHDAQRGGDLAATLLAWLDVHGDVAVASKRLGIHPNTMRYRLKRLRVVAEADLDDPAVRLEFHVRLGSKLRKAGPHYRRLPASTGLSVDGNGPEPGPGTTTF